MALDIVDSRESLLEKAKKNNRAIDMQSILEDEHNEESNFIPDIDVLTSKKRKDLSILKQKLLAQLDDNSRRDESYRNLPYENVFETSRINSDLMSYLPEIDPVSKRLKPLNYFMSINEMVSLGPSVEFCVTDVRNEVLNHSFSKDNAYYFFNFLYAKNVSKEEKDEVNSRLSEEDKNIIFEYFCKYYKTTKYINGFFYPWHNGIPLFIKDEVSGIDFKKNIIDILTGKRKPTNIKDIVYVKCFLDSDEFLNSDYVPGYIKESRELFSRNYYMNYINQYFDFLDRQKVNQIKNGNVDHYAYINLELLNYLLSSMPYSLNDSNSLLEKSIYLYYKLCTVLSYDCEFYNNQNSDKFKSEYDISNVTLENNNVVCYTFSYIYSSLLKLLGNIDIKERIILNHEFTNEHAFIEYVVDDIAIKADSTRKGAEADDLTSLKIDSKINSLRCLSFDLEKQKRFNQAKKNVEDIIKKELAVKMQQNAFPSDEEIEKANVLEKLNLFNEYAFNSELTGISYMGYLTLLKEKIGCDILIYFDSEEQGTYRCKIIMNPYYPENSVYKMDMYRKYDIIYLVDLNTKEITIEKSSSYVEQTDTDISYNENDEEDYDVFSNNVSSR